MTSATPTTTRALSLRSNIPSRAGKPHLPISSQVAVESEVESCVRGNQQQSDRWLASTGTGHPYRSHSAPPTTGLKIRPCTSGASPQVEASRPASTAHESHTISRQMPPKSALDRRSSSWGERGMRDEKGIGIKKTCLGRRFPSRQIDKPR